MDTIEVKTAGRKLLTGPELDAKLLKLADQYRKAHWRTRRLYRGQALNLISAAYAAGSPVFIAVWNEWQALANEKAEAAK